MHHSSKFVLSLASTAAVALMISSPVFAVDPPPDVGYPNFNTATAMVISAATVLALFLSILIVASRVH